MSGNNVNKELSNYIDQEGKVKIWPSKRKHKLLVLDYLSSKFDLGAYYSEKEINEILNKYHLFGDHAILRRELFNAGYIDRTNDCSKYWRVGPLISPEIWGTDRLIIKDSILQECEELQNVYNASAYMNKWTGDSCEPDYIYKHITEGDLPPNGLREYYKIKTVYKKETSEIVGLIEIYHGYPDTKTFFIGFLFIHPEYQRKGYGHEIVEYACKMASGLNYPRAGIGVHLKNWPAIRFWTRCGFDHITRISGDEIHNENTFCVMRLEKTLEGNAI